MTIISILFGVICVVLLVFIAGFVRKIGQKYNLSSETQRKLVHVSVGLFSLCLPLFFNKTSFAIFALCALIALLMLRFSPIKNTYGAAVHSVKRSSWGDILLLVSVSVLFFLSKGDPVLYVLPLAVITISDACAAVIGTEYGRLKFGTNDRKKSVEGTVVFFVVTWIVCAIILIMTPTIPRESIISLTTIISSFSALVEASSWHGLDNLFVPLGIFALLAFNPSDPVMQLLLAIVFIIIMVISSVSASLFGLPSHTCRAVAICLFLTLGIINPVYSIFTLATLGAVLLARNSLADFNDALLQLIVVMTLVGVIWLVANALTGFVAIEFYTITFSSLFTGIVLFQFKNEIVTRRIVYCTLIGITVWIIQNKLILIGESNVNWLYRSYAAAISALSIIVAVILSQKLNAKSQLLIYKMAIPIMFVDVVSFGFVIKIVPPPII